jgi:hypothetical protein
MVAMKVATKVGEMASHLAALMDFLMVEQTGLTKVDCSAYLKAALKAQRKADCWVQSWVESWAVSLAVQMAQRLAASMVLTKAE